MGLSHVDADLHGVQFHPESIASVAGYRILANFLKLCGQNVPNDAVLAQLETQILRLDQRFPDQMHSDNPPQCLDSALPPNRLKILASKRANGRASQII